MLWNYLATRQVERPCERMSLRRERKPTHQQKRLAKPSKLIGKEMPSVNISKIKKRTHQFRLGHPILNPS